MREDFYVSQDDLDNYLFLLGDVKTTLMYTYLDVENISSIDGLALALTQAQEKLFQLEAGILLKQYFAYDVFGNYKISGDSAEDAINQLRQNLILTARYVNKTEIMTWSNRLVTFDNIIEDGIYKVYRIFSHIRQQQGLDPYLYFENYTAALMAIKAGVNQQVEINTLTINVYVYLYVDANNVEHHFSYTTDDEIEQIINEILQLK
ncbi:hypothetical protein [Spiroplasma endosymbiont of Ammophila pubescens]|uniref:hypothetical protein n=1 Tax=Spiroplasma endosymbiont of Ammophila pubescens TaxID=3066315 RepID=UPI0032B1F35F